MNGYIKKILKEKNFGFIEAGKKEYFFHRDDFVGVWDDLVIDYENREESILVDFDEVESRKGPRAAAVHRA